MAELKKHELPALSYGYDALEPYITKEIMELHHGKHHATYIKNLNDVLDKFPELFEKTAEELLMDLNSIPEEIRTVVKNNGGGHVNHSMFWEIMAPAASAQGYSVPKGTLAEAIEKQFGSFEDFKTKFNDAGAKRFGSGWVWLVKNKNGDFEIISTANQDNPMSDGFQVIMGNDVWEHAYYLQYKNVRMDYLKAWWNLVNWEEVNKRFN